MLCFKIRNIGFWEYLVYTIGLSVAFIMFGGLAVNWTLPFLHITDKPLSLWPVLICFDIFLVILGIIAYKRNSYFEAELKSPKFTLLDQIFIIIPFCFPFMAVIGAFLLNNHGTNIVTMILLGAIAVYVFLVVLFRDKLNENVFPWALWMIGLSLLLTISIRGWNLPAHDIIFEGKIFKVVNEQNIWRIKSSISNVYNSCISLNILPKIISSFSGIYNIEILYKLFFIIIFSSITTVIYNISKYILRGYESFLSSLFFIAPQAFFLEMSMEMRQSIALVFFALMILLFFSKNLARTTKKFLFVIFGFSMTVSHYSTSYIAFALFTLTYLLTSLYKKYEDGKIKKGKLHPTQKQEFYLTGILILLLLIFGFLWYSQISDTASNVIGIIKKTASNIQNIFLEDLKQPRSSLLDQFNLLQKYDYPLKAFENYKSSLLNNTNIAFPTKAASNMLPATSYVSPISFNLTFVKLIYIICESIKKLFIFFMFIGVIYYFKKEKLEISILAGIFLIFSLIIMILPIITVSYSFLRFFLQAMIILSPFSIWGSKKIFRSIGENKAIILLSLLIIIFFFYSSGFLPKFLGGNIPTLNLNNKGEMFETLYYHESEFISGIWLSNHWNQKDKIQLDNYAKSKLIFQEIDAKTMRDDIFTAFFKDNYIYLSYENQIHSRISKVFNYRLIIYTFPTEFLNENKNKIYNNGGSEIFK